MIRQLEQISMNAWPALQTIFYDGWILRFADGITRRSNSINPVFESKTDINEKIDYCENRYLEQKLPVIYKITSEVFPKDLDIILQTRNYTREAETSVQILQITEPINLLPDLIRISEQFDPDWVARFVKFNGYDISKTEGYGNIIRQIINKRCFVDLIVNNSPVGCGLGVVEGKYLGIFDIVVNPEFRGKGYASEVVNSLLNWGFLNGAKTAYLQVMTENNPALKLYDKIGFKELYKYWYRVKRLS